MYGVTSTTSSVSCLMKSRLRNSVPSTGMSLRPGKPSMFLRVSSEIRPASASEPPDGSSTVELAWRFLSAGI